MEKVDEEGEEREDVIRTCRVCLTCGLLALGTPVLGDALGRFGGESNTTKVKPVARGWGVQCK